MTKTYSEARQAVLFSAAREYRRIAARVLDDFQNEVELRSESSTKWGLELAQKIAREAEEFENKGHEFGIASRHSENALYRSRKVYVAAFENFEARVKRARRQFSTL